MSISFASLASSRTCKRKYQLAECIRTEYLHQFEKAKLNERCGREMYTLRRTGYFAARLSSSLFTLPDSDHLNFLCNQSESSPRSHASLSDVQVRLHDLLVHGPPSAVPAFVPPHFAARILLFTLPNHPSLNFLYNLNQSTAAGRAARATTTGFGRQFKFGPP